MGSATEAVPLVCTASGLPCLLPVLPAHVYRLFINNNKISVTPSGTRYFPLLWLQLYGEITLPCKSIMSFSGYHRRFMLVPDSSGWSILVCSVMLSCEKRQHENMEILPVSSHCGRNVIYKQSFICKSWCCHFNADIFIRVVWSLCRVDHSISADELKRNLSSYYPTNYLQQHFYISLLTSCRGMYLLVSRKFQLSFWTQIKGRTFDMMKVSIPMSSFPCTFISLLDSIYLPLW